MSFLSLEKVKYSLRGSAVNFFFIKDGNLSSHMLTPWHAWPTPPQQLHVRFLLKENCTFLGGLAYHPQSLCETRIWTPFPSLCIQITASCWQFCTFNGSSGDTLFPPSKAPKTHPNNLQHTPSMCCDLHVNYTVDTLLLCLLCLLWTTFLGVVTQCLSYSAVSRQTTQT